MSFPLADVKRFLVRSVPTFNRFRVFFQRAPCPRDIFTRPRLCHVCTTLKGRETAWINPHLIRPRGRAGLSRVHTHANTHTRGPVRLFLLLGPFVYRR